MIYTATVFYNTRREAMDKGFEDGDMVARVGEPFAVEADTIAEVGQQVFRLFNIGEGAVRNRVRSMSVGDVVHVESAGGGGVWLTVEGCGFGMIDRPTVSGPITA